MNRKNSNRKARLLGSGVAAALVLLVGCGSAPQPAAGTADSTAAPAEQAETPAPAPTEAPATAAWVLEPTIEADNIDVLVQYEPNRDAAGTDSYGNPACTTDYNSVLQQYAYPLAAYTKDGKIGIIQYDGTLLAQPDYKFTYVGNHAQLFVGNNYLGANPSAHDMWLVTDTGVASRPYSGTGTESAIVYYPNGWGVPCWDDTIGIGSFGEGGFFKLGDDVIITGAAALTTDLSTWQKTSVPGGSTNYYPPEGGEGYVGLVPLYNSKRVGTEVYEDVTVCADGLFGVKKDGKWGYLDTTGAYVFPCEYDSSFALPASENFGSHPYLLLNGWPDTGRAYAYTPSEGYLVLCKDAQYALYTVTGEEVIPFGEYEALRPVCGGKLWAKQGGKWGVLALAGATATEPATLTAPTLAETAPEPTLRPTLTPPGNTVPATDSSSEYIIPDSDTRRLTDADVSGLSAATLRLARNEILARHGRLFDSADLQAHFDACSWYHGTTAPSAFNFSVLSATEQANIELIKSHE